MRAKGIDISKWQGTFTYKNNVDFMFVKCSEGTAKDPQYDNFLPEVKKVELRGAYHYYRTEVDPVAQAKFFFNAQAGQGFTALAVDYEKKYNNLTPQAANDLELFWNKLRELTNKQILLYTSPYIYRDNLVAHNSFWTTVPIWMAHFNGKDPETGNPETWGTGWRIWQYSADGNGKGSEYGVASPDIDLDVFNGGVDALRAWLGFEMQPPPPPAGNPCDNCEDMLRRIKELEFLTQEINTDLDTKVAKLDHMIDNDNIWEKLAQFKRYLHVHQGWRRKYYE